MTSGFADFGQLELSAEPRSAWNNSPVNARNNVTEEPWYELYGAISAVTDAVIAIDSGLVITDAAGTARTRAFGKFMQASRTAIWGCTSTPRSSSTRSSRWIRSPCRSSTHTPKSSARRSCSSTPRFAQPDILWDDWKRLNARLRTAGRPSDFGRPNNWLLGPADSTDAFVNWVSTPVANRVAFQLRTKDRRIQGAGGPSTPGSYVGFNQNNIFAASRGTYRFSWYYFHRYGTTDTWQNGPQPAMLVTEMNLLKAEALIRLGRADEALPLINASRQANGQLPPVTLAGPPDEPGCVPRKLSGPCGSLWDALRYEKRIEGIGVSGVIAYFDARGWQTLPEYSIVQLPVPGRELAILRRPLYTYGGPGGLSSAPAPDPERCPVALPRC